MPRFAPAVLPAWAMHAHEVLGTRSALAVLAVLTAHDEALPHAQVAADAGLSAQTASDALRKLEDAGIVTGSLPRAQRPGPGVRWSVDRAALWQVLDELQEGLGRP